MSRFLRLLAFRPDDGTAAEGGAGTPAAWEKPDGWPDQFADPGALLESYQGLRPEMDRLRSQMEAERQQFTAAIESLQQAPQPAPTAGGFDPDMAAYAQAYEQGDAAAMLRIASEASGKNMVDAVSKVLDERLGQMQPAIDAQQAATREASIRMAEDVVSKQLDLVRPGRYQELLPQIRVLVAEHPHYLPTASSVEGYATAILDVAKLAEHETLQKRVGELETERAEKLAAQTVSGAGRGSVYSKDEQQAEFERIKATKLSDYSEIIAGR